MATHKFARVSEEGNNLELDGHPFYFAGANCYYLMTRSVDPSLQHQVVEVLDAARAIGLTVLRTWAFCDGPEWNALQPAPGEFNETVFKGLDFVIHEAAKRGLKLMLVFTNYWKAFGGMSQYVRWSCQRRGVPEVDKPDKFYADPWCQDIFQNFLVTLTTRINTFTQVAYRDDPTILAWSLANEPRCNGDFSGSVLQDWIQATSEFVKSIDPNHLLTVGLEGFLGSSTPALLPDNPFNSLNLGCDFFRNHLPEHIDFAEIHLWPDNWLSGDLDLQLRFVRRWINSHVDVCQELHKPLIIAEFGKKPAGFVRSVLFERVFDRVLHHAKSHRQMAGSVFWMTAAWSYPDYDGFTVYLPPAQPRNPLGITHRVQDSKKLGSSAPPHSAARRASPPHASAEVQKLAGAALPTAHTQLGGRSAAAAAASDMSGVAEKETADDHGSASRAEPQQEPLHPGRDVMDVAEDKAACDERTTELIRQHAAAMAALNEAGKDCTLM